MLLGRSAKGAVADGIDTLGLIKTAQMLQEEQMATQQQQMMQMVQQAGVQEGAKAMGGMAQQQMAAQLKQGNTE